MARGHTFDPGRREMGTVADTSAVDSPGYAEAAARAAERTGRPGQSGRTFEEERSHDAYTQRAVNAALLALMAASARGMFPAAGGAAAAPKALGAGPHAPGGATSVSAATQPQASPGANFHGMTGTPIRDHSQWVAGSQGTTRIAGRSKALPRQGGQEGFRDIAPVDLTQAPTMADPTQLARLLLKRKGGPGGTARTRPPYAPVSGGSDAARLNPNRSTLQDRINANQGPVTYQKSVTSREVEAAEDAWIAQRYGYPAGPQTETSIRNEMLHGRRGGSGGPYRDGVKDFIEQYLGRTLKGGR